MVPRLAILLGASIPEEPPYHPDHEPGRGICKPGDTGRAATFQSPMRGTIRSLPAPISTPRPPLVKCRS